MPFGIIASTEAAQAITAWDKYGLPGCVIGALFALVLYLIRSGHTNTKEILEEERKERRASTEAHVRVTDKLAAAVDRLSDSFRESMRK